MEVSEEVENFNGVRLKYHAVKIKLTVGLITKLISIFKIKIWGFSLLIINRFTNQKDKVLQKCKILLNLTTLFYPIGEVLMKK